MKQSPEINKLGKPELALQMDYNPRTGQGENEKRKRSSCKFTNLLLWYMT